MRVAHQSNRPFGGSITRAVSWLGRAVSWPIRVRSSRIGFRLFLAFQAIIVLTGLIGILAIRRFNEMSATSDELNRHDLPEVEVLGATTATLYDVRRFARDPGGASAPSAVNLSGYLADMTKERETLIGLEQPNSVSASQNDRPIIQSLVDGLAQTQSLSSRVQSLLAAGDVSAAKQLASSQLVPLIERDIAITDNLQASELNEAAVGAAQVQNATSAATEDILILTSLSVVVSILLAAIMTRWVVGPLGGLLRATEEIARGNLDARPVIQRRDELGRLASAFDAMRRALRETISTLQDEQRRTQAIIDATADGIVLVDRDQIILQMNPAAERLSGWASAEAAGHDWGEVFGCGCVAAGSEASRLRTQDPDGTGAPREFLAELRDGRRRWLAETCAPIVAEADADRRFVIGFRDVTPLKAVEQMKSDFVAMVSHELRAPLTTVLGSVEMLASLDPGSDPEVTHEVLGLLQHQSRRLQNVVEEVLQLTRFEAGRLTIHFQELRVEPFLRATVDQLPGQWLGDPRPVTLRVEEPDLAAWADPVLLEVVLRNLLENAHKYTPPATPIEIEVRHPGPTRPIEIRVIDHGPGIPPDQRDVVFDRFARGASVAGDTRGYGLGLYIARELARGLGGDVSIAPSQAGACFVISLRAVDPEPAAPVLAGSQAG